MAERSGLKTVLGACKFCAAYLLKSQTAGNGATNRTNLRIAAVRKTNCGGKPHALDTGVVPFSRKTCQTRKKRARKSAVQNSGEHVSAACSARKTYENGEAKENVDNKGTPVSGEDKEGTGNGSESRQRKAGATMKNPAQFLNIGSLED